MVRQLLITCLLIIFAMFITGCGSESKDMELVEGVKGGWTGSINIPNQPLHIIITIESTDELQGKISIPIQAITDYPLKSVKMNQEEITFVMDLQGSIVSFDGKLMDNKIEGTFTQSGNSFPFELVKVSEEADEGQFLSVQTELGPLYGELEKPAGEGPFPVVIIIPGSGPTDRNGNSLMGENNSLKFLAEQLADNGIASVRYDKRGAGKNRDTVLAEEDVHFEQFIHEANAWVQLLKEDNQFSKVGIIGHSQGSLEGMMAAQAGDVDAYISLAGVGSGMDEVLYEQLKAQLPENLLKESEEILLKLKQGEQVEDISPELQSIFRPSVQPFIISMLKYNPTTEIKKLTVPVLVVNGEQDIQVPASEAKKLHEASSNSEILILEKMNHVLKDTHDDRQENLLTYSNPELPLSDGLVEGIVTFLVKNEFLD